MYNRRHNLTTYGWAVSSMINDMIRAKERPYRYEDAETFSVHSEEWWGHSDTINSIWDYQNSSKDAYQKARRLEQYIHKVDTYWNSPELSKWLEWAGYKRIERGQSLHW